MAVTASRLQPPTFHQEALQPVLSLNAPLQTHFSHRASSVQGADYKKTITLKEDFNPTLKDENLLVTSPYTTQEHLLDLTPLLKHQQLLAQALTHLKPIDKRYATLPYHQAFNWPTVIAELRSLNRASNQPWTEPTTTKKTTTSTFSNESEVTSSHIFYIVVFRSQIPPTTDRSKLGSLDERSHAEANRSGGLLKYWFGIPDAEGRNLATCVWRDFKDARPASSGDGHKAAARATASMYTEWKIERLGLKIEDDGEGGIGDWSIGPWETTVEEERAKE